MYQELFRDFENTKNLAGKSWEHAVAIDLLNSSNIQDCSIHCFHYQQMLECFFKHILETKTQYRYNFDIDCQEYIESVAICDELIKELISFVKDYN